MSIGNLLFLRYKSLAAVHADENVLQFQNGSFHVTGFELLILSGLLGLMVFHYKSKLWYLHESISFFFFLPIRSKYICPLIQTCSCFIVYIVMKWVLNVITEISLGVDNHTFFFP